MKADDAAPDRKPEGEAEAVTVPEKEGEEVPREEDDKDNAKEEVVA